MSVVNPYLYNVLGVETDASQEDIKRAYRRASMQHHPDKGGDEREFAKIALAYNILSDPGSRERYDFNGLFKGQEEQDMVKHMAINRMMHLMNNVVESNRKTGADLLTLNIIEMVIDVAKNVYTECQNQIAEIQNAIENIKMMGKKCVFKGEGENIFELVIEEQLKGMERQIEQQRVELDIARQIVDFLKDYDYEA